MVLNSMVPSNFLFVFTELLRKRIGQFVNRGIQTLALFLHDKVVTRKVHGDLGYLPSLFYFENDMGLGVLMGEFLYAVFNLISSILFNCVGRIDVEEGDAYVDYFC